MSIAHVEQPKKRRRAALGPHTRQHRLLEGIDWRSRQGQTLIAARAELTAHVGGNPSNVQKALIERAARLTLYIEMMDARALAAGTMSERDSRQYLAWSNSLRLTLRDLGVKAAPAVLPSDLHDYLDAKAGARATPQAAPSDDKGASR